LNYVRGRADLVLTMVLVFVIGTFGLNFQITTALLAKQVFHRSASGYGLLSTALAIGACVGAVLATRRTRRPTQLFLLGTAVATSPTGPDLGRYPTAALPVLAPGPGLLNDYDWGGFLIWSAPRTPVFVDGRLTPYLPGVVADYTTILNVRPGWREVVARRGVRELLVRPDAPVAVRAAELGWPVRALGSTAVLITVGPGP
jgi:hypothetical protein